jgi:myo-inositol-1(or 4)-monophosphatase
MDTASAPTLEEVQEIARQAGKILLSRFGKTHQVQYKGPIDPVTEADKLSETLILNAIRSKYPEHRIVSEETGANHKESPYCWYIDPLDGTVNFTHGIPIYSVSIAVARNNEVVLAAVYDPSRDELFSAEKGKGATLNGCEIQAGEASQLVKALLVTGFPYDIATTSQTNLDNYSRFAKISQGVRRLGSAALDCCYVAAGRFDGYWEMQLAPWDVAAGTLIVREAGGIVSGVDGDDISLEGNLSILTANRWLHSDMLSLLKEGH